MKFKCNLNNNTGDNRALVNHAKELELVQTQELNHYYFHCCSLHCIMCKRKGQKYIYIYHKNRNLKLFLLPIRSIYTPRILQSRL